MQAMAQGEVLFGKYLVLRFLCEDLSKRLDEVLDAILRAVAHQDRMQRENSGLQTLSGSALEVK